MGLLEDNPFWDIQLTYPSIEEAENCALNALDTNTWQTGRKPLLVFQHGANQNADEYCHIFAPLARQGFLVASIDTPQVPSAEHLAAQVLCTARWFASEWPERNEHLNCDLAFMGHSRGGLGAALASRLRSMSPGDPTELFDLKAIVSIAPNSPSNGFSPQESAPFLALHGGRDEDNIGGAVTLFDALSPEDSNEPTFDKIVVWGYDIDHDAFGGGGNVENQTPDGDMVAKGNAIATEYIVPFLRWKMLNEEVVQARRLLAGEVFPGVIEETTSWWKYLSAFIDSPLVFTAFTVDQRGGETRYLIDTMDRSAPQAISPGQPSGATVTVEPPGLDRVKLKTTP